MSVPKIGSWHQLNGNAMVIEITGYNAKTRVVSTRIVESMSEFKIGREGELSTDELKKYYHELEVKD